MKNIKIGSIVSQKSGDRFGVTKIIGDKKFLAIWVGDKNFTDKTTFNGFMRNGDFTLDNILFTKTNSGIRRIKSATGVWGLLNGGTSIFDAVNS